MPFPEFELFGGNNVFQPWVNAVQRVVDEAVFQVSPTGIEVVAEDVSSSVSIQTTLPASSVERYEASEGRVAVPVDDLWDDLDDLNKSDSVLLEGDPDSGEVRLVAPEDNTTVGTYDYIDPSDTRRVPDISFSGFEGEVEVNGGELNRSLRVVEDTSDTVLIGTPEGESGVYLYGDGDFTEAHGRPEVTPVGDGVPEGAVAGLYSTKFLNDVRLSFDRKASTTVRLKFGDDYPVQAVFNVGPDRSVEVTRSVVPKRGPEIPAVPTPDEFNISPSVQVTANGGRMKDWFGSLEAVDDECRFSVEENRIETRLADPANALLVVTEVSRGYFDSFSVGADADGTQFGVGLTALSDTLSKTRKSDGLTFTIDAADDRLQLNHPTFAYKQGLFDPDRVREEPTLPDELALTGEVETSGRRFKEAVDRTVIGGGNVALGLFDGRAAFAGPLGDPESVGPLQPVDGEGVAGGLYSGNYMENIADGLPGGESVGTLVRTGFERPVTVSQQDVAGGLTVTYLQAPRKRDDGEPLFSSEVVEEYVDAGYSVLPVLAGNGDVSEVEELDVSSFPGVESEPFAERKRRERLQSFPLTLPVNTTPSYSRGRVGGGTSVSDRDPSGAFRVEEVDDSAVDEETVSELKESLAEDLPLDLLDTGEELGEVTFTDEETFSVDLGAIPFDTERRIRADTGYSIARQSDTDEEIVYRFPPSETPARGGVYVAVRRGEDVDATTESEYVLTIELRAVEDTDQEEPEQVLDDGFDRQIEGYVALRDYLETTEPEEAVEDAGGNLRPINKEVKDQLKEATRGTGFSDPTPGRALRSSASGIFTSVRNEIAVLPDAKVETTITVEEPGEFPDGYPIRVESVLTPKIPEEAGGSTTLLQTRVAESVAKGDIASAVGAIISAIQEERPALAAQRASEALPPEYEGANRASGRDPTDFTEAYLPFPRDDFESRAEAAGVVSNYEDVDRVGPARAETLREEGVPAFVDFVAQLQAEAAGSQVRDVLLDIPDRPERNLRDATEAAWGEVIWPERDPMDPFEIDVEVEEVDLSETRDPPLDTTVGLIRDVRLDEEAETDPETATLPIINDESAGPLQRFRPAVEDTAVETVRSSVVNETTSKVRDEVGLDFNPSDGEQVGEVTISNPDDPTSQEILSITVGDTDDDDTEDSTVDPITEAALEDDDDEELPEYLQLVREENPDFPPEGQYDAVVRVYPERDPGDRFAVEVLPDQFRTPPRDATDDTLPEIGDDLREKVVKRIASETEGWFFQSGDPVAFVGFESDARGGLVLQRETFEPLVPVIEDRATEADGSLETPDGGGWVTITPGLLTEVPDHVLVYTLRGGRLDRDLSEVDVEPSTELQTDSDRAGYLTNDTSPSGYVFPTGGGSPKYQLRPVEPATGEPKGNRDPSSRAYLAVYLDPAGSVGRESVLGIGSPDFDDPVGMTNGVFPPRVVTAGDVPDTHTTDYFFQGEEGLETLRDKVVLSGKPNNVRFGEAVAGTSAGTGVSINGRSDGVVLRDRQLADAWYPPTSDFPSDTALYAVPGAVARNGEPADGFGDDAEESDTDSDDSTADQLTEAALEDDGGPEAPPASETNDQPTEEPMSIDTNDDELATEIATTLRDDPGRNGGPGAVIEEFDPSALRDVATAIDTEMLADSAVRELRQAMESGGVAGNRITDAAAENPAFGRLVDAVDPDLSSGSEGVLDDMFDGDDDDESETIPTGPGDGAPVEVESRPVSDEEVRELEALIDQGEVLEKKVRGSGSTDGGDLRIVQNLTSQLRGQVEPLLGESPEERDPEQYDRAVEAAEELVGETRFISQKLDREPLTFPPEDREETVEEEAVEEETADGTPDSEEVEEAIRQEVLRLVQGVRVRPVIAGESLTLTLAPLDDTEVAFDDELPQVQGPVADTDELIRAVVEGYDAAVDPRTIPRDELATQRAAADAGLPAPPSPSDADADAPAPATEEDSTADDSGESLPGPFEIDPGTEGSVRPSVENPSRISDLPEVQSEAEFVRALNLLAEFSQTSADRREQEVARAIEPYLREEFPDFVVEIGLNVEFAGGQVASVVLGIRPPEAQRDSVAGFSLFAQIVTKSLPVVLSPGSFNVAQDTINNLRLFLDKDEPVLSEVKESFDAHANVTEFEIEDGFVDYDDLFIPDPKVENVVQFLGVVSTSPPKLGMDYWFDAIRDNARGTSKALYAAQVVYQYATAKPENRQERREFVEASITKGGRRGSQSSFVEAAYKSAIRQAGGRDAISEETFDPAAFLRRYHGVDDPIAVLEDGAGETDGDDPDPPSRTTPDQPASTTEPTTDVSAGDSEPESLPSGDSPTPDDPSTDRPGEVDLPEQADKAVERMNVEELSVDRLEVEEAEVDRVDVEEVEAKRAEIRERMGEMGSDSGPMVETESDPDQDTGGDDDDDDGNSGTVTFTI
jgi:DNA polymerase III sliding clamp (beta) subunit (PCNA family)